MTAFFALINALKAMLNIVLLVVGAGTVLIGALLLMILLSEPRK